jgi:hypothetical protein
MTFDANSALPPGAAPMKMIAKTTMGITQKTGPLNKDGNIEAELTYDEIRSEVLMNGQSVPGANANNKLVGKIITVTYDRQGNPLDVKLPSEVGLSTEAFKQILDSIYGNLPTNAIGVGEVVAAPLDFTLPLPIPGAAPLKMEGDVKLKLISIDKDSTGRSARFDSTIDGKISNDIEVPSPNGKIKLSLDFKMNGDGTSLKDLDKGLLRSSESNSTLNGKIKMGIEAGPGPLPPMNLQGRIKVTLTSEN